MSQRNGHPEEDGQHYIYNKREEDFPSLKECNDYLEEVEDMTYNLIEGIDVAAIEAKIAKYQEENAEQIINARARKAEELAAALKASQNFGQGDPTDGGAGPNAQGIDVGNQGQYSPTSMLGGVLMQPRPTGVAPQPVPVGAPADPLQGYATDDEGDHEAMSWERRQSWGMDNQIKQEEGTRGSIR